MQRKSELSYLGLKIKPLAPERHGKDGFRVKCDGKDFATLEDARIHVLRIRGYGGKGTA